MNTGMSNELINHDTVPVQDVHVMMADGEINFDFFLGGDHR